MTAGSSDDRNAAPVSGMLEGMEPDYTDVLIDLARAVASSAEAFAVLAWAVERLEERIDALSAAAGTVST